MESSSIAIIILVCMIVMYLTEIIPLAVTATLSCLAMGVFKCCSLKTVFSGFANDVTMMIIGMCVVGDTLFATGAATWLGSKLIRFFGNSERAFLTALILLSAFLSAFLSNSATVAMMLPIASAAIAASKGRLLKKYTFMPIGFAAVAGGGLTLIGSTPQIIAQGMLLDAGLEGATFFEYFITGMPKVVIMIIYFLTLGDRLMRRVCTFPEVADAPLEDEGAAAGEENGSGRHERFTFRMLVSVLIMMGCVTAFILQLWTFGMVSMLGACLCIVTRCVSFKSAFRNLDWNTIILVAGSLGFAACLDESGAGVVIANTFVGLVGASVHPMLVLSVIAVLSSLLGNLVSASAATPILAPICLYMAPQIGMDPRALIIAVVVFSSIVYTSPTSTPPNTMPLVAGYRYMDYVKVGGLLNLVSVVALILMYPLMYDL